MARQRVVLWYTAVKELHKNMRKIAVEESINGNGTGKKTAEEESMKVIEE